MNKIIVMLIKVIIGISLLAVGVNLILAWRQDFVRLLKGCAGIFVFIAGVIILAIARE